MLRFRTPEEIASIQARIAAQCRTYTHSTKDEETPEQRRGEKRKPGQRGPARWGDEPRKKRSQKKVGDLPEKVVLKDCMALLERHPRVSMAWRVNVGAMKNDAGRYVKFSFVGCADILFVSTTGRFGACECKATGKTASEAQKNFIANVNKCGGLGVIVDHPGKLALALEAL